MRLKKVEIIGFKSFADKIAIEFYPGITAIVGPNGCGKSNISDAIRWVLGEQSAKSLRGHKMHDIIFAGTATRKPLNFAEVSLIFDEVNGFLPTEYEEVVVTRRLHRNGDSDYFLNKQPVRLKDVQNLFLDSGIGKNSFSVFEQGKIDQVINYTPLERRYIFEEAAGILRFLQRKREALNKLEMADQNLNRVKDIHQEVEKQIVVLEQQAEKAKIFRQNKAQLEKLEKCLLVAKCEHLKKREGEIQAKEATQIDQIEQLREALKTFQETLQKDKAALNECERHYRMQSEQVYKTRSEKEIKSKEKQGQQERLKELLLKEKKWIQDLENLQLKKKMRSGEKSQYLKRQADLEKEIEKLEAIAKAQQEKVQELEVEVSQLRHLQQGLQQNLLKLIKQENQLESEIKQNKVRVEGNLERKNSLEQRRTKLEALSEELSSHAEEKREHVQHLSESIDAQKEHFHELESRIQALQEEIQAHQKELDQAQSEWTESSARHRVLMRLREDQEGFSQSAKKLLQEAKNPQSPCFQKVKPLYECFIPEKGKEGYLAAAMKPYVQTLVVEKSLDLEIVLEYAQKAKMKDFSLICLEQLTTKESSHEIKFLRLTDCVIPNTLSKHFLDGVFLIDDAEIALKWSQENETEVIISEDVFVDRHQVFFYAQQSENSVFVREAELKHLEKRIQELDTAKNHLQELLKRNQNLKGQFQNEKSELDKAIRRQEMKFVEANFNLQRCQGDLEKALLEQRQIIHDAQALEKSTAGLLELVSEQQQLYEEAKKLLAEEQQKASSISSELEKQVAGFSQEQRLMQEKNSHFSRVSEENRKLAHQLNVLEVQDQETLQQESHLQDELDANRELQEIIRERGTEFDQDLITVEKTLEEVVKACEEAEQKVMSHKNAIADLEKKNHHEIYRLKDLEQDLNQIQNQLAQNNAQQNHLENELDERFALTLEQAKIQGFVLDKTQDQTEKNIRQLRQEIDSAKDINMTSIEEFEKHKARYEFLHQQMTDMNVSRDELIQIITQLDAESRKIFKETFFKISENFKKNFKILFNGGEADLQFTENQDVLEAGIEIIAKPPGKQMRSINLLSGGEKCLTAMALLFAIFEVKSAPFCILDEIDAPLDDSNVERFVNVVKQFIDRCQFIIITHNKRTMAIADVLYGVSMEEKGVSKLLSMQFNPSAKAEPVLVN